jgi:ribonucleoside-diphosphate reductase alpha chain
MKNRIIAANGSVQNIDEIPQNIKDLYKTVWEIKQKALIDMAADRGAYICQSQSLNLFIQDANFGKLTSMHFYAWEKGLKTGMYYLRTKSAADPIKFTVDKNHQQQTTANSKPEPTHVEPQAGVEAPFVPRSGNNTATAQVMEATLTAEEEYLKAQIACSLDDPEGCEMCSG